MFKAPGSMLLVVVFAFGVMTQAQQPAPKPAPTSSGTISGKVVNENGQPLPNVQVYVRPFGTGANPNIALTDREGAFEVSGLDSASYSVSALAPAYVTPIREPQSLPPRYRPGDSVTLTLIKGGAVTGTVTNSVGDPVVGVAVRVQMIRDANGRVLPRGTVTERLTDDRGVYRVYRLMTGTYVVSAGGPTISANSFMNVFENDAATYAPSSTRDTAAEISVRTGEEVSGVDIRYRAEPGRTISGEVKVPDPRAVFTVMLNAIGESGAQWQTSYSQSPGNSEFVINGIGDGDYDVYAQFYLQTGGEHGVSEQQRISVRGADVAGIVLTTKPFGSVAGRLVLEETTIAECTDKERPVFIETMVSAWHNENAAAKRTPPEAWSMGAPVPPNPEGNFVLRNLAPGEYFFAVRPQATNWYLRSALFTPPATTGAKAKPVDASRVWTNVKPGDRVSGLTMTLAHGAATLRGKLALAEGEQAPPRMIAYLVPAETERAEEVLRFFSAQVSPEAKFAFNNVPPGRYWIMAQAAPEGAPAAKIRFPHETAWRARLRRNAEAAKNEIELKPCQDIPNFKLSLRPATQN